jgi:hypothetical protein
MKTSTTYSYCDDEVVGNEVLNIDGNKNENYLIDGDSFCRKRITSPNDYNNDEDDDDDDEDGEDGDDISDNDELNNDGDYEIGTGLRESDSFLVKTVASNV